MSLVAGRILSQAWMAGISHEPLSFFEGIFWEVVCNCFLQGFSGFRSTGPRFEIVVCQSLCGALYYAKGAPQPPDQKPRGPYVDLMDRWHKDLHKAPFPNRRW